jgi:hypothetical protein
MIVYSSFYLFVVIICQVIRECNLQRNSSDLEIFGTDSAEHNIDDSIDTDTCIYEQCRLLLESFKIVRFEHKLAARSSRLSYQLI